MTVRRMLVRLVKPGKSAARLVALQCGARLIFAIIAAALVVPQLWSEALAARIAAASLLLSVIGGVAIDTTFAYRSATRRVKSKAGLILRGR